MRRVLVTGASRGIGRAVAAAFAGQGDRVAVHYGHDRAAAEATVAALAGEGHVLVAGDLGDPHQARQVVLDAIDGLGGVDVLVNNAAVAPSPPSAHAAADTGYDDWTRIWRAMVDVNLLGAANVTHTVVRHLVAEGRGGSIVNVGSRGAYRGEPDYPAYGATKAALHAFGQSLAVSLAPHGISVASVAPGFVGTERQETKLSGDTGDAIRGQSPFGRVATPEDVASAVLYLASSAAEWSSGAVLDVNGASYLR